EDDDLQVYLNEMEHLKVDFSDLEDLDMEEIQEMQDAIDKVKQFETPDELDEIEELNEQQMPSVEIRDAIVQRETMFEDFSDLDDIDLDELKDMKEAINGVKQEIEPLQDGEVKPDQLIHDDLEARIREELSKKIEEEEEEVITPEKFLEYLKNKRDKIWYHALWYIAFEVEDHTASKVLLYDMLKEVTSKSPIDPIPEHQFYFGLGYLLRLNMNNKQIVRYLRGGTFKININVDNLKNLMEEAGVPISNRPVIPEEEKKQMFSDFLKDDFLDI
ncbi:MAG: hypothetical protein ACFFBP_13290, partial [Promethearchaeota archaeon]